MSCGVGHRFSSDLVWLWLWLRLAATAPIGPLTWEPPYAAGVALKKKKKEKKKALGFLHLRALSIDVGQKDVLSLLEIDPAKWIGGKG